MDPAPVIRPDAVRWLFFDFAGTLAFNDPARAWHYLQACARRGFFLERRAVWAALRDAWAGIDCPEGLAHPEASKDCVAYDAFRGAIERDVLARLGVTQDCEAIVQEILAAQDSPGAYSLYPESAESLRSLRQAGYHLGVVSNFTWGLPELISALGIRDDLVAVVTSAQAGYRKPHRGIFDSAVEATSADPAEVLFVGDSLEADVHGPAAYGFQSILVDRRAQGKHPVPAIAGLDELAGLLSR